MNRRAAGCSKVTSRKMLTTTLRTTSVPPVAVLGQGEQIGAHDPRLPEQGRHVLPVVPWR
jgi:hypothetical protein